ncbi:MAG: serine hydrolase [Candidatus Eremiobacteraeota bacterium]|nr:serine hydrolase [Candidatus Eremiobacteraeota bacterium]
MELADLARQSGLERPSIVVERLSDGRHWTHVPARTLYPASMIKVPLVAAALIDLAEDRLEEHARVRVGVANVTANDLDSPLVAGYEASLEELFALTISRSDNVGTNQLFDLVGRERGTRLVRERLGLRDTSFRRKLSGGHPLLVDPQQTGRNAHPAVDAATLFRAIAQRSFAGAERLHGYLEQQEWNAKLTAGLRPGDRFAHKTGDTDEVSHDGGILTTVEGERYVLVVYSASTSSEATDARFAELMRRLRPRL